ncbi:MAG: RHS repeat domain-containing protein [Desulfosalsimonadaceae bacterium]
MNGTVMLLPKRSFLLLSCLICMLLIHPLSASAESVTYQYDVLGRLTGATYGGGINISYTYDAVGNRLTEAVTATVAAASPSTPTDGSTSGNDTSNTVADTNSGSIENNDGSQSGSEIPTANAGGTGVNNDSIPADFYVYEDAEDGVTTRWEVVDEPSGAYIFNVYAADRESQVIELNSDGLLNGFSLLKDDDDTPSPWNDTDHKVIQWSMKYASDFVVSVAVQTSGGLRYISFTPEEEDTPGTDADIIYGLGAGSMDGQWHTYIFDLSDKLNEAQPDVTIHSLIGFYVRGNGQIDDVLTWKEIPDDPDFNGE